MRTLAYIERLGMHLISAKEPPNLLQKLFFKMWQAEALLPEIPSFQPLPRKSWRSGEKKNVVQLFAGCVMPECTVS